MRTPFYQYYSKLCAIAIFCSTAHIWERHFHQFGDTLIQEKVELPLKDF